MAASTDNDIDSALDDLLSSGWNDTPAPAEPAPQSNENWTVYTDPGEAKAALRQMADDMYPPVPTRDEPAPRRKKTTKVVTPDATLYDMPFPGQDNPNEQGLVVSAPNVPDDEPDDAVESLYDLGLLSDLAAGRISAADAAAASGKTEGEVHSALATALREVDPKELIKALGLQAAEQRLKSGALYGAVLHDLVLDMASGRLKPETKIELAKMLSKVAGLEPKEDKTVGAGSGFVLNISMGPAAPQQVTIEST